MTLIVGDNARGKTSILEAIYLLSRGKGFREDEELELLQIDMPHGHVTGAYVRPDGTRAYEASVTYKRVEERLAKRYFIDASPTTISRYRQLQVPVVLFAAHHLDIITHSPSYRREYLDTTISAVDPLYAKALSEYTTALRKRNVLLEEYTDARVLRGQLDFWDGYLIERAGYITGSRVAYIEGLNVRSECGGKHFRVVYTPNTLTRERLDERYETELAARRTLIGPQKDDYQILFTATPGTDPTSYRNVHKYGSRSQQRLALLWMKFYEIDSMSTRLQRRPTLLLDDIFSEFDHEHKHMLMHLIPQYQSILTTTDEELLTDAVSSDTLVCRI